MVAKVVIVPTTGSRLELRECAGDAILTTIDLATGNGVLTVLAPGPALYLSQHLAHIAKGATRC